MNFEEGQVWLYNLKLLRDHFSILLAGKTLITWGRESIMFYWIEWERQRNFKVVHIDRLVKYYCRSRQRGLIMEQCYSEEINNICGYMTLFTRCVSGSITQCSSDLSWLFQIRHPDCGRLIYRHAGQFCQILVLRHTA